MHLGVLYRHDIVAIARCSRVEAGRLKEMGVMQRLLCRISYTEQKNVLKAIRALLQQW